MSPKGEPHLLRVRIDAYWPGRPVYRVECPYIDGKGTRPCSLWEECTVHPRPAQPEVDEPPYDYRVHSGDWPCYDPEADPEAVRVWTEFLQDHEAWEGLHDGFMADGIAYHPRPDACWVAHMVEEFGPDDGWSFDKSLHDVEIVSPLPVDYRNEGNIDEPLLVLTRYGQETTS